MKLILITATILLSVIIVSKAFENIGGTKCAQCIMTHPTCDVCEPICRKMTPPEADDHETLVKDCIRCLKTNCEPCLKVDENSDHPCSPVSIIITNYY